MTENENKNTESCGCTIIHNDVVNSVRKNMLDTETIVNLAEFFKVFSDPTRLNILKALSQAEMCVCDISALLGISQSAVSHQLKVLRQSRLVKYRRDGKVVYYSIDDDHIRQIVEMGLAHIREDH